MGVDYGSVLPALLPEGQAWNGHNLRDLLVGLSQEFTRIDSAFYGIVDEADPSTADGAIDHWMKVVGIIDTGYSLENKRAAVIGQLLSRGGNTIAYYNAIAYAIGYVVEITELMPALAGKATAGDPAYDEGYSFVFLVSVLSGDMTTEGLEILVAAIEKVKAAHTVAIYDFLDTRARVGTFRVGQRIVGLV